MTAVFWCIEILATAVEGYLGISVVETLGKNRYDGNKQIQMKWLAVCMYTAITTLLNMAALFSWAAMLASILLIAGAGMMICHIKALRAVFGSVAYIVILTLQESFLITIISYVNHVSLYNLFYQTGYIRCIYLIIDKLIDCCLFYLYKLFKQRTKGIAISAFSYLAVVLVGLALLSIFIEFVSKKRSRYAEYIIGICGIIILIGLFAVTQYLNSLKEYHKEQVANQKLQGEARMAEQKYSQMHQMYQTNAKIFHDFDNHLTAIDGLLMHGKVQEARKYIQSISCTSGIDDNRAFTGVAVADAILNEKVKQAKQHDISIKIDASLPPVQDSCIFQSDLCIILANLLDNALEACGKVPDPLQRLIDVRIHTRNDFLIFRIANTVLENPLVGNQELKTSKKDSQFHGIGLQSVRSSVNKYNGSLLQTFQDGWFLSTAIVSYKKDRNAVSDS
ncbi:MAG TPA: hypothetical protein DEP60_04970 [Ruminococcaceae bacterium]|nr:hypothetical protein [Oscillospiraceae bacterium]